MVENDLDNVFELSLLFLIGECSKYSSHVNGITFERKFRGDKMIVWCNAHSKEMLESIKNEVLPDNLRDYCCLDATEHNDSRYKVGIKVVDHKAELQRLKIVNRHSK